MARHADLDRLYALLGELESRVGGMQRLSECTGYMDWPDRGLYIFFATDESRAQGEQPRITRIGTHAVSTGSGTSLWNRLRNHRGALSGTYGGGGNHRGSVFRKRVGEALIERHDLRDEFPEWGVGSSAGREQRLAEHRMEDLVSGYLRELPFLFVAVDDEPGPASDRAYLEQNLIALVSNYQRESIDPRAESWLGRASRSEKLRRSGLWNINHVDETYDSAFLDRLATAIQETTPP